MGRRMDFRWEHLMVCFFLLRVFLDVGSVEARGTGFEAGW